MGNKSSKSKQDNTEKENLAKYPPINYRKIKKSGFRIAVHIDIGMKDFETGMTFGKNSVSEIHFSENNQHLKLLKSFEEESQQDNKDKLINTLVKKLDKNDEKEK